MRVVRNERRMSHTIGNEATERKSEHHHFAEVDVGGSQIVVEHVPPKPPSSFRLEQVVRPGELIRVDGQAHHPRDVNHLANLHV